MADEGLTTAITRSATTVPIEGEYAAQRRVMLLSVVEDEAWSFNEHGPCGVPFCELEASELGRLQALVRMV